MNGLKFFFIVILLSVVIIPVQGYEYGQVVTQVNGINTSSTFKQYAIHESELYFTDYDSVNIHEGYDNIWISRYDSSTSTQEIIFQGKEFINMETNKFRFFDIHPNGTVLYVVVEKFTFGEGDLREPESLLIINLESNKTLEFPLSETLHKTNFGSIQVDEKYIVFLLGSESIVRYNHQLQDETIIDLKANEYDEDHGSPTSGSLCIDETGFWIPTYVANNPYTNDQSVFYHINATGQQDKVLRYAPGTTKAMDINNGYLYYFSTWPSDTIYKISLTNAEVTNPPVEAHSFSVFIVIFTLLTINRIRRNRSK